MYSRTHCPFSEMTVQKDGGVRTQMTGAASEQVSITARDPSGHTKEYPCSLTSDGTAMLCHAMW